MDGHGANCALNEWCRSPETRQVRSLLLVIKLEIRNKDVSLLGDDYFYNVSDWSLVSEQSPQILNELY